jgi:phage-related protein
MTRGMRFDVYFFKTEVGNEPAREWIKSLNDTDKHIVGKDIAKVQIGGPQIGEPTVKALGDGLFEVRSTITNRKVEARILFTTVGNKILLLHGFIKAARKTPHKDIDLARKRMGEAKRTNQP